MPDNLSAAPHPRHATHLPCQQAISKQDVSAREEADNYRDVVAVLNPELRVIRSGCNLQWIAQRQSGHRNGVPIWKALAFCGTKEGLLLRLPKNGHGCTSEAWTIIEALPDYYPK
jgi:hypothetical protein